MNFLEEQSQDSSIQYEELQKSHKLFKNYYQIKDSIKRQNCSKQSSHKSVGSVQKAIQIEEQKNLETRIALTQKQYSKARQNNILLLKKLGQAEQNSQFFKFELQKLKREKQQDAINYKNQLQKLKLNLLSLQSEKQFQQKNISTNQILVLRSCLESKDKQIARLQLKIKSLDLQIKSQQQTLKSILIQKQQIQRENQSLKIKTQTINITQNSTGAQLLQLQQSRQAITRLLYLLRTTQQYRRFSNYAQQSKQIIFLTQIQKDAKKHYTGLQYQKKKYHNYKDLKLDERYLWAPTACYKILLGLKLKYQSLNQSCIQQILFQLNKIWLQRQQLRISKLKSENHNELNKMKRKNFQKYDEIIARKQIERLKKQLQCLRFNKRSPHDDIQLLKNLGQYQDQLRLKERQIKLLSQRVKLMDVQNNNYDKILYLEGSLWVIDKILQTIDQTTDDYKQSQKRVRNNLQNINQNQMLLNTINDCFQLNGELIGSINQKLLQMKQNILKKIGNSKSTHNMSNGHSKSYI